MNQEQPTNSIKDNVLKSIAAGRIVMKPRWHFMLRAVLLVTGVVLAGMTLLYVVSFALFMLRESGDLFAPQFGLRGLWALLVSLPLVFVCLAIVFLVVLEILVRRYEFAYRKPLVYSVLGISLIVFLGSFAIDRARVHDQLLRHAVSDRLPLGGKLYRSWSVQPSRHAVVGVIVNKTNQGFNIQSHRHESFFVLVTNETALPEDELAERDLVAVFGPRYEGTITAVGIRRLGPDDVFILPPGPMMRHR